ncbi:MAG TPA: hypothetical protein PLJ99_08310 [Kiritimatiellia bacterium]|nr:hypothetical protein [Kiritimatiellia bacterium]
MAMDKTNGWKVASWALWALAALLALRLAWLWRAGPREAPAAPGADAAAAAEFRWPAAAESLWARLRSGEPAAAAPAAGSLAARYRLAGVFLMLSDEGRGGGDDRCAILDERASQRQFLAAEGEQIGDIRVVRVERDHVVLSDGAREELLMLAAGTLGERPGASANAPADDTPAILETNRFGNRVGETRWEFSRQAVLDYYQEMMDNPERLASLFLAMEPDRDEEGKVAGYRLNMEAGEKEFYTQVGFRHGDVVRKVNSMRMTSQRRAEYFIGEFVQDRLGAVVIDIERDGQPLKLVYLVK